VTALAHARATADGRDDGDDDDYKELCITSDLFLYLVLEVLLRDTSASGGLDEHE
jgi:hypothetical protein